MEEIVASTSLLSDRVLDLFSKPEVVTPFAWKFSTHPDNPVKEMEASVENFIGLVAKRLSDAGLKEEAERENILDMIHLVLATAFGSYVMKTHISKKQPEAQTQKKSTSLYKRVGNLNIRFEGRSMSIIMHFDIQQSSQFRFS